MITLSTCIDLDRNVRSSSYRGFQRDPGNSREQSGCNTPLSVGHMQPMSDIGLLSQPGLSRPPTTYLDMPIPLTQEMDLTSGTPSDADLERTVQDILRTADLNTVTKREIRRQLEEHFGMDLTSRKATINAAIDRTLLGQS